MRIIYKFIMSKVLLIGISKIRGATITSVSSVDALKGRGLVGEKHFKENKDLIFFGIR